MMIAAVPFNKSTDSYLNRRIRPEADIPYQGLHIRARLGNIAGLQGEKNLLCGFPQRLLQRRDKLEEFDRLMIADVIYRIGRDTL